MLVRRRLDHPRHHLDRPAALLAIRIAIGVRRRNRGRSASTPAACGLHGSTVGGRCHPAGRRTDLADAP